MKKIEAPIKSRRQLASPSLNIGATQNTLIKTALDAIIIMDSRGRVLEFNPAAERIFGYKRKEAIGKELAGLIIPPVYRTRHRSGLANYLKTGKGVFMNRRIEISAIRKNGEEFPVELTIARIGKNEPIEFMGTIRDISERKTAEAALIENEKRFNLVVQNASDIITVIDKSGKIIYQSPALMHVLGRKKVRIGANIFDSPLVHPDDANIKTKFIKKLIAASPKTEMMANFRMRHANGDWRNLEVIGTNLLHLEQDQAAVVLRSRDVTERVQAETRLETIRQAVTESEAKLQIITDASPVALWMTDKAGGIIFVNQTWLDWTGRPLEDQLGKGWHSSVIKENLNAKSIKLSNAIKTLSDYHAEFKIRGKNGEERWLDVRGRPYFDDNNEYAGYSGSASDITTRKKEEKRLLKTNERESFLLALTDKLHPLLDASNIITIAAEELGKFLGVASAGYIVVDKDNLYASTMGEWGDGTMPSLAIQRQGLTNGGSVLAQRARRGEIVVSGDIRADSHLFDAAQRARFKKLKLRSFAIIPLVKNRRVPSYFYLAHSKPRIWRQPELELIRQAAERTWAALGQATAERELRESEQRYRKLFNAINQGFCVIEVVRNQKERPVDLRLVETNQTFKKLTGLEDIDGIKLDHQATKFIPSWLNMFDEVIKTGRPIRFEAEIRTLGEWFECYVFRVGDSINNQVGVLFTDIKERKRLEQQKDDFVATTTHELKTPVTSMKMYIQMLERKFLKAGDEASAGTVVQIDKQLERLSMLISDLLDITKIESGQLTITAEEFNYNQLLEDTVASLQMTTKKHKIRLSSKARLQIITDRGRLAQVLTNLIENAIKYSPGGGTVTVSVTKNGNTMTTCVADHGVGIAKTDQAHLFERFARLGGKTTKDYPGLGLGLYISAEIMRRLGGRIWVESKLKKGSKFYIELPLAKPNKKA